MKQCNCSNYLFSIGILESIFSVYKQMIISIKNEMLIIQNILIIRIKILT